ncbi:MAG TPA: hypothetical protein VIF60_24315 [Burkholderiaceae bacterium]|jgi:hypothetical protein
MGILDDALNDPGTMGLLNAGGAMLQASGPSLVPRSFGQVLGAGLQGLQAGYSGTQQQGKVNQALQLKNMQAMQALRLGAMQQAPKQRAFGAVNGAPGARAMQGQLNQSGDPTQTNAPPAAAGNTGAADGMSALPDEVKAVYASAGIDPDSQQAKQIYFGSMALNSPGALSNGTQGFYSSVDQPL